MMKRIQGFVRNQLRDAVGLTPLEISVCVLILSA